MKYSLYLLSINKYQNVNSFNNVSIYEMDLMNMQRLIVIGSRIISLFLHRLSNSFYYTIYKQIIKNIIRRVVAISAANSPDGLFKYAQQFYYLSKFTNAVSNYERAIMLKNIDSYAELSWILISGRNGVLIDYMRAFKLANDGNNLGCMNSRGVLSYCYAHGYGCIRDEALSFQLACESAHNNSRYGQFVVGWLYRLCGDGCKMLTYYRLAAEQNLDHAQERLGYMHEIGWGVEKNYEEALQWYRLAAGQGLLNILNLYNI